MEFPCTGRDLPIDARITEQLSQSIWRLWHLSAGQTLLALNGPLTNFPGTGAYLAWLLIALAGLSFSSLLLTSHRARAIVGLLAAGCDLAYCLTFLISPVLQAILMSFGGAFWMIWHLLVIRILLKRSKE